MHSRRAFIESGLALTAVGVGGLGPLRARSAGLPAFTGGAADVIVVVDTLHAAGERFTADAREIGLDVHAFRGDAGKLWMSVIEPRLRAGRAALGGLAAPTTLFALEYLTRGYGLRTVYRDEHARDSAHVNATRFVADLTRPAPVRPLPWIDVDARSARTLHSFLLA